MLREAVVHSVCLDQEIYSGYNPYLDIINHSWKTSRTHADVFHLTFSIAPPRPSGIEIRVAVKAAGDLNCLVQQTCFNILNMNSRQCVAHLLSVLRYRFFDMAIHCSEIALRIGDTFRIYCEL